MSEVTLESLNAEIQSLKAKFDQEIAGAQSEFVKIITEMRRQISSRKGDAGARGERGERGTDAVVKIQRDGNVISVLSSVGSAEIIAEKGSKGDAGASVSDRHIAEVVAKIFRECIAEGKNVDDVFPEKEAA